VGPATGNINFPGEIQIQGKVQTGFTVMGGLRVLVNGIVEEAIISSGNKVEVSGGIKGGGKGIVRARTKIEANFAEKVTLLAVNDINLNKGAAFCTIKTNGKLSVAADEGRLLGGVCQARKGISVANVGRENGTRTEISFGQDYLIKDRINETAEEIKKIKAALAGVDRKIKQGIQNPEALNQARIEKVRLMKILEGLRLKAFTLEEQFEEHHESEVRIWGTVYPGVVLESHGRYYEIILERKGVVFYFDRASGIIKEKPLN
jgi:uncharacterized protein (DUF342 family)